MNTAVDRARWDVPAEDEEVQSEYLQALRLIEILNRRGVRPQGDS